MTNPHENAFRRWSLPDTIEAAAPERQDTMEEHLPSSFRVYTPDEIKSAPMRRGSFHDVSAVARAVETDHDPSSARTLLKWTGIGIVAGLGVLAALIIVLNVVDDGHRFLPASSRSAMAASLGTDPAPAKQATPAAPVQVKAPAIDFEVVNAPPPKLKKAKKKATTAAR